MTAALEVSGHELATSVDCKVAGCTSPAAAARGVYALLCDDHRREKQRRAGRSRLEPVASPTSTSGVPLADLARGLVRPAQRLERAAGARKAAREEARAALEEFNGALTALRSAAEALLKA